MRLWNKIRSRFGRGVEDGLAEEMRLHRGMLEDRFRAEGLTPRQAREQAAREFGPAATALEDSRVQWSFAWLESLWTDARYAIRALRRSKTFAATAVLTLAVGLALASVAFTLFNAYVLRPFAVHDPDSLFAVYWQGKNSRATMHSWRMYEDIRGRRDVFSDALATRTVFVMGATRHWSGKLVSGNYFRMLGAHIAQGRPIEEDDARTPGGDNVVVISHAAWKAVYNLDPTVLGKQIALRGYPYEVIGVAAQEFTGLGESPPDFWVPMTMHTAFRTEDVAVEVVGRLRAGVNRSQAEAALGALAPRDQPDMRANLYSRATALAYSPLMVYGFAPIAFALALVLATCCANVANMMLARGLARQREIGVRLSVGAGRTRVVRQLLTEALVIAGLAGLLGIVLARIVLEAGQRIFFATISPEFAKVVRLLSLELDHRVFLFALGVATLAAAGAALLPAMQSTRLNLTAALRGEFGAGIRSSRLRDGLVVIQVVVCAVLLVSGALLYRRASVFQAQDPGMRQHGVIDLNASDRRAEVAEFLRTWPGAEAVAVAARAPWYGRLDYTKFTAGTAAFNFVSPDYFRVFDIPLKSGRGFTDAEARTEAPVAIVSAATARAFWPGEDPIGKTIVPESSSERCLLNLTGYGPIQVVGVAADVRHGWVFEGLDKTCVYLPVSSTSRKAHNLLVWIRGDENRGAEKFRALMLERWPLQDGEAVPLSAALALQTYPFRAAAWIGLVLGLVAMALSISGMYGVMSYLVNQRSKEIGIRVALGATPSNVLTMILRRSLWLSGLGVLIGGGVAAVVIKLLVSWSTDANLSVLAWDNFALFAGSAVAGAAGLLAALGPSSRAARVDPNSVLRAD